VYSTTKSSLPFPYNLSAAVPFSAFIGPCILSLGRPWPQNRPQCYTGKIQVTLPICVQFSMSSTFHIFMFALARFSHLLCSLSISPVKHRLMGLSHNQEKRLAKFCSITTRNWSLEAQTYFFSLAGNTIIFLILHQCNKESE
jgi:hypothetical protein